VSEAVRLAEGVARWRPSREEQQASWLHQRRAS